MFNDNKIKLLECKLKALQLEVDSLKMQEKNISSSRDFSDDSENKKKVDERGSPFDLRHFWAIVNFSFWVTLLFFSAYSEPTQYFEPIFENSNNDIHITFAKVTLTTLFMFFGVASSMYILREKSR